MADVKWIKVSTDMFESNRKIKQIEMMPEGDTILVIWLKLLLLAGNVNDGGAIYLTPEIPYTEEMLATELRRPLNTVKMALTIFEKFGMVEIVDDVLHLSAWEKYQNTEKLNEIREYNRLAQQRSRAKKKLLRQGNVCQYCGEPATGYDHIVARANGGTDDESNLVPCCKRCNSAKRDKPVDFFLNLNRDELDLDIIRKNEKLARFVRYDGYRFVPVNDSHLTCQPCHDIEEDEEKDKEKESHSFIQSSREEAKLKYLGGTLGKGVVMLSDEQFDMLLDECSIEEFNKYVGIVADMELSGKHYKKKTHYQAILDMVKKDRGTNG